MFAMPQKDRRDHWQYFMNSYDTISARAIVSKSVQTQTRTCRTIRSAPDYTWATRGPARNNVDDDVAECSTVFPTTACTLSLLLTSEAIMELRPAAGRNW